MIWWWLAFRGEVGNEYLGSLKGASDAGTTLLPDMGESYKCVCVDFVITHQAMYLEYIHFSACVFYFSFIKAVPIEKQLEIKRNMLQWKSV